MMSRSGRKLVIAVLPIVLLASLWAAFPEKENADGGQHVGLITGLPILWPEGDLTALVGNDIIPSPASDRLSNHYRLTPADIYNLPPTAEKLLLVQPAAMSPDAFVILDQWVRTGGHVLIFADPALQWESIYPLGDPRRPPYTSLLSPLLRHWGVELFLPVDAGEGAEQHMVAGHIVRSRTFGLWQGVDGSRTGRGEAGDICRIMDDGILAECRIGRGRATLVADADLFDGIYWQGTGLRKVMGRDDYDNMEFVRGLIG